MSRRILLQTTRCNDSVMSTAKCRAFHRTKSTHDDVHSALRRAVVELGPLLDRDAARSLVEASATELEAMLDPDLAGFKQHLDCEHGVGFLHWVEV